jgi:SAM-dependent methyltransferase
VENLILWIDMSSQTQKDIRTITDLVDIEYKSVLELGCGDGRITFELADKVREIVAIDIDVEAIEDARQRNLHGNVTFLVENMEDFDLKRKVDLILSMGVGYMYLRNLPGAIKNISHHLGDNGIFLAICSSPDDEYQKIVDLLVEESVRTAVFYNKFERLLSEYFTFEKKSVKGELKFADFEEISLCFQRELKEEYQTDMSNRHVEELKGFFQRKDRLAVENNLQAYICRLR